MIFRISCSPGRANFQKNASGNKSALNQKQNGGLCGRPDFFIFFLRFFSILGFSKSARAPSPSGLHSSPKDKPYALRWPRRGAC